MKPKKLKIGPGIIHGVGDLLNNNSIQGKLLYVSDPVVDGLYGDCVKEQLKQIGLLKEVKYLDDNSIACAMAIAERTIATDVDCIIAMGGGKVLDVCKYASYISKCPLLSIPTTAANDGIASPIAVLKRKDGKPKSLGCDTPAMLLVDTDIIANGPIQLIKAGIGDTMSNYMALLDWEFACERGMDKMNGYAYLMSKCSLDALMKTQYTKICQEFVEVLVNSLVISGIAMDFAGSSRPVSGSEHLFSHALDYYGNKQNLHGLQVALGTVAVLKLINTSQNEVIHYLSRFQVDVNPRSLGIDEDAFIFCMQHAAGMRNHRYTYLHEIDLGKDRLRKVYRELTEEL